MRKRIAAVIIKEKKILLARDDWADFFSTPGGALEDKEDFSVALSRELKEELQVEIIASKLYISYQYVHSKLNVPQLEENYLVSFKGDPKPSAEIIEIGWFSKGDIESGKIKVLDNFRDRLFPHLVKDKLL